MEPNEIIKENLKVIHQRITDACTRVSRDTSSVRLLLATKTVSAERVKLAIDAGENLIGENKVQELKLKDDLLSTLPIERHFIGHLQTNKVKDVLKYVSCIQSVDRLSLVEALDKRLQSEGRSIDVFVQFNTSNEESKFGLHPSEAHTFFKSIKQYNTLNIKGLMTIGLLDNDNENVRPSLSSLRQIREELLNENLLDGSIELSMGMSKDLEIAIEEGATMVRVGSAIFGDRIYPGSYYWDEGVNVK